MVDTERLDLLLIDEDPEDRALSRLVLGRDLPSLRVHEAAKAADLAVHLRQTSVDLVITDLRLSWSDGSSIVQAIRESRPGTPIIAFTTERDPEVVVEAMKSGVDDFVFKGSKGFLSLPASVQSVWEKTQHRLMVARSEPWLGTLLEQAGFGVYRSSLDGRLLEATPGLLRILGVSSVQEALAVQLPTPYFQGEAEDQLLDRVRSEETTRWRQMEIRRPDGTTAHLELVEVLLLDVDNEMVIDVLARDVSASQEERRSLAQRIEELEQSNADLSQFAYMA